MIHSSDFCDSCGAALPDQAVTCPACGEIQAHVHALPALTTSKRGKPVPSRLLMKRYRIIEQIGEGGFGVVYKARDRKRGRIVAIKQITLAALSTREIIDATDSYNRETTILPGLEHNNLPRIYDHFTDPEHWYIVMQYIEGQTLEEMLAKEKDGRLPLEKVLKIGTELCEVLAYLHAQRPPIIFRDVKPGNIMVTRSGHVYLIDFGIARKYRPEQKRDTGALGSPGYAAPEQYGSAQSTARTDIYGLGATLQTMLTGKEPTEGADIKTETKLPAELKILISRMLEQSAYQRPSSMLSVEEGLDTVKKRLTEQKKQAIPGFAWVGTLWCLLFFPVRELLFPGSFPIYWFLLALICSISYALYYLYKGNSTTSHHLSRKETIKLINKGLYRSVRWLIYPVFWGGGNLFGEHIHQPPFLINMLLVAIWIGVYIFIIKVMDKIPQWIQVIQSKLGKKQGAQAAPQPQQQMSQKP